MIGFAPSLISTTGNFGKLRGDTTGFWTSYAQRLGTNAQVLLHARYISNETIPDSSNEGEFLKQDSTLYGLRLRFGSPNLGYSLEGASINDRPEGRSRDTFQRYSLGIEYKVSQNYWLAVSIGGESGRATQNDSFVLGALKWGFNSGPTVR